MASEMVFIDTSGFYALLSPKDRWHKSSKEILIRLKHNKTSMVTTDFILDETATLMVARGLGFLAKEFFQMVESSKALQVYNIDAEMFHKAKIFFLKNTDQGYSFTDCTSFTVMKSLRLNIALTSDEHFEKAGFRALLK